MTTVQMPGTNQPIDYDFINQLVTQVNSHDNFISQTSTNVTSKIFKKDVVASKLKIYADSFSISPTGNKVTANTQTLVATETLSGFSSTPLIIATATSENSTSSAGCTVIVSNVTKEKYEIYVRWLETKSNVQMSVNVLAIGSAA